MKCLYVAQLADSHDRDELWVTELKNREPDLALFPTHPYERMLSGLVGKLQNRLHFGSVFRRMRADLLATAERFGAEWIHFRMPLHFDPATIAALARRGAVLTCYYNDDPFSHRHQLGLHSLFKRAIPFFTHHFVFREKNVREFRARGARSVSVMPPFYAFDKLYSGPLRDYCRADTDAVFIGHWEADQRQAYLEGLARNGFNVVVRGSVWDDVVGHASPLSRPFDLAFGAEFARYYREAKAGICFFSKINNDLWTRRPLEIIAAGGLLVCERTEEAISHFEEGKEAFFFSSLEELIRLMTYIRENPEEALKVRERGQAKLLSEKYSLSDRVEEMLQAVRVLRAG